MRKYSKYIQKHNPISLFWLRVIFSIILLMLAALHVFSPYVKIDNIALAIIAFAVLPWLALLVRTLEFPGGWKVEFKDFENIAMQAKAAGLLSDEPVVNKEAYSFQLAAMHDPILALAGLRIEIEKRLSQLVNKYANKKQQKLSVGKALRVLEEIEVLQPYESSTLADMTSLLNAAVHGDEVDPRAAAWAIDVGPRLLRSLDERMTSSNTA